MENAVLIRYLKLWIFFLSIYTLTSFSPLASSNSLTTSTPISGIEAQKLRSPLKTRLTLTHARTLRQITWGLMQKNSLPPRYGMLFHYPFPQALSFWSFNCLIDLDLAYLDESKIFREVHFLKAYPEKMDPKRPVKTLDDLKQYSSPNDKVVRFFSEKAITSSTPAQYALEMRAGSFRKLGIRPGDLLKENGEVVHTLDLSSLKLPNSIRFPEGGPWSLWFSSSKRRVQITEWDAQGKLLKSQAFNGLNRTPPPVFITHVKTRKILIQEALLHK